MYLLLLVRNDTAWFLVLLILLLSMIQSFSAEIIANFLFFNSQYFNYNWLLKKRKFPIWRASVASKTLTGVTQSNRGCLFIYIYVWTYVCNFVL